MANNSRGLCPECGGSGSECCGGRVADQSWAARLVREDLAALDSWRAARNLKRTWEMGCPFEGAECILLDTSDGSERRFKAANEEKARAKAAAWVRNQHKADPSKLTAICASRICPCHMQQAVGQPCRSCGATVTGH